MKKYFILFLLKKQWILFEIIYDSKNTYWNDFGKGKTNPNRRIACFKRLKINWKRIINEKLSKKWNWKIKNIRENKCS